MVNFCCCIPQTPTHPPTVTCFHGSEVSANGQGQKETEHKRMAAAETVNRVIEVLNSNYDDPKVIVMGDFNDSPQNNSLLSIEEKSNLYNPFKKISTSHKGSLNHDFE